MDALEIATIYGFHKVCDWVLARIRTDYFPGPRAFYEEKPESQRLETTSDDAIQLFTSPWIPVDHNSLQVIAGYFLARDRALDDFEQKIAWDMFKPDKSQQLIKARDLMVKYFQVIINGYFETLQFYAKCSDTHPLCVAVAMRWIDELNKTEADVFTVLYRMRRELPRGAICKKCLNEAHKEATEGLAILESQLPHMFGIPHTETRGWQIPESTRRCLSREHLLSYVEI